MLDCPYYYPLIAATWYVGMWRYGVHWSRLFGLGREEQKPQFRLHKEQGKGTRRAYYGIGKKSG